MNDCAFNGVGGGAGAPGGCVLMEDGGGELAEGGDGLAGAEDVSEEAGEAGREFSKISGRRSKAAPPIASRGMSAEKTFSTAAPVMFSG